MADTYDVLLGRRSDGLSHRAAAAKLAARFDDADHAVMKFTAADPDDLMESETLVADDHNMIVSLLRRFANE